MCKSDAREGTRSPFRKKGLEERIDRIAPETIPKGVANSSSRFPRWEPDPAINKHTVECHSTLLISIKHRSQCHVSWKNDVTAWKIDPRGLVSLWTPKGVVPLEGPRRFWALFLPTKGSKGSAPRTWMDEYFCFRFLSTWKLFISLWTLLVLNFFINGLDFSLYATNITKYKAGV